MLDNNRDKPPFLSDSWMQRLALVLVLLSPVMAWAIHHVILDQRLTCARLADSAMKQSQGPSRETEETILSIDGLANVDTATGDTMCRGIAELDDGRSAEIVIWVQRELISWGVDYVFVH